MDRAAGAYAGRPLAIRTELTENVRFPCPDDIWDDGTDPCLIQFERAGSPPDPVSPFVHIARLCLILGRVCELSDSSSEDAAHHVPWRVSITDETMRRFDTAIAEYASNLPPVMRFDLPGGPVPSNISSITLVMVTLQHTTARVLLHRPSAMRLLPSTSIHLDIMASSLIVASRALAWLENVTTHRDMRDPDPFASWNVFECGLGCAVVLACPERGDRDQIEEAFQVVTRFLDMAGKRSPVARNMRRQLDEVHRASGRGLLREEYRDDPSKVLEV
ncbi:hypothetical protein HK104_000862 [Borealophlyctis nickersoniae]|nr:hypothetical protein HK104_000862 [Borealophlyctis nickersoniae]